MTREEKINELKRLDEEIEKLKRRKLELNPFALLKEYSNKKFGEEFSEKYILEHCPSFKKDNSAGHDFYHDKYGRIEVKSARLPVARNITYNQCHLDEADYYLFANYDTESGGIELFFVPTKDLKNEKLFAKSLQHTRNEEESCYTIQTSQKNMKSFEKYRYNSFEELNKELEE